MACMLMCAYLKSPGRRDHQGVSYLALRSISFWPLISLVTEELAALEP